MHLFGLVSFCNRSQRISAMNQHDQFIIGSLAASMLACMGGTAAGGVIVLGPRGAVASVVCFGFIVMVAIPVGYILAFTLMRSPRRWQWMIAWSTVLGCLIMLFTWGMASFLADW